VNWNKRVAWDTAAKANFHNTAKRRLRKLASLLALAPGEYDLRSNKAGPAVCGEITLHTPRVYVQISQSASLGGILYRTCEGRKDYTGGQNHFAPLEMLDDLPTLRERVEGIMR